MLSGDVDVALQLLKAGALLEVENHEEGNAIHVVRTFMYRHQLVAACL